MNMDFDVSVLIITSDRQYIPGDEYDNRLDGDGVFVMLTNDELNTEFGDDNSICIYRNWFDAVNGARDELKNLVCFEQTDAYVACRWQIEHASIPNTFKLNSDTDDVGEYDTQTRERCVMKYLDGYRTNQEIKMNVFALLDGRSIEEYLPAIMLACHTKAVFGDREVHGYLPAIGQLFCIAENIKTINAMLRKIDERNYIFRIDKFYNRMGGSWWSVTECNESVSWFLNIGELYNNGLKIMTRRVLPLFSI